MLRVALGAVVSIALIFLSPPPGAEELSSAAWVEDIQFLDETVKSKHPDPFTKTSESDWDAGIQNLRQIAASGDNQRMAVEMMKQVALVGDGHSHLEPTDALGFDMWFPVRFYQFDDGIYITVAHKAYADLVGAKVLRIGKIAPEEALAAISVAISHDNKFQEKELGAAFLSSAPLLEQLGVVRDQSVLPLRVEFPDGARKNVRVSAEKAWFSGNYRFWGELFGPPHESFDDYVTPFENGKPPLAYRTQSDTAPPYFANRSPYWFRWDEAKKTLVFQFNFSAEIGDESFKAFRERMWAFVDEKAVERFVIDVRYNFGGDGSMMVPLIQDMIRRPEITAPGKLYVLVGRQNFSAGVMLLGHLRTHTRALFIGEPAGAPYNHYGDPVSVTLPNSKMTLHLSSLYWQLGHPSDERAFVSIDIPVLPSADDYFSGVDAAYNVATSEMPTYPLLDVFLSEGGEAGRSSYVSRKSRYGHLGWWRGLDEDMDVLNKAVSKLTDAGEIETAKALLKTWIETQPENEHPRQRLLEMEKETE